MITDRFAKALHLAIEAHDGQLRKGTTTPYISHPMWYYSELSKIFSAHNSPVARALADTVAKMHKLSLKDQIPKKSSIVH